MSIQAAQDIYTQAKSLYENGMTVAALELLNLRPSGAPLDAQTLELKGIIHHSLRDFESGRDAIEAAGLAQPLSSSAKLILADCYFATNKRNLARSMYCGMASSDDVPFQLLSGLAMGLSQFKEYELALDVCKQASEKDPNCHHARYGVAFYMSKCGRPPELVYPIIQKAVELAPHVFHYRMAAATLLCQLDSHDRAYLAIADATPDELKTVTCRCCFERLIRLYKLASDDGRRAICESLLAHSRNECH